MLDLRIHGKYQIEIRTRYRLRQEEEHTEYDFEIYMFIPNYLDLDHDNYPKYLFYRDLQTWLRFETPAIALQHVAAGNGSPFRELEQCFHSLAEDNSPENRRNYENQLKMFSCVFRKALSEQIAFLAETREPKDIACLVEEYVRNAVDILGRFRSLRPVVAVPAIDEITFSISVLVDEYLSLLVDDYSYQLLEVLEKTGPEHRKEYKAAVLRLITDEIGYREEQGYPARPVENDDNEELVYRLQALRQYTESVLFLDTRARPEGKLAQQMIFGAAAGLAMIWATAIALYAQYKFGIFTMAFFITLVVSYIFKDRIKEVVRDYLSSKLMRYFYDQKIRICTGSSEQGIGISREGFSFVTDDRVDAQILKLRNRSQLSRVGDYSVGEKIILYRKKVNVLPEHFEQVYREQRITGFADITRYSVFRLTRKMGNPKRHLFVTDGRDFKRINARKVHRINFIVRYTEQNMTFLKRFRVIMDRGGIRRIEEVESTSQREREHVRIR